MIRLVSAVGGLLLPERIGRIPVLPLLSGVRFMSRRDKIYGNEEGHAQKNEVRKEKWINKKKKVLKGYNWREDNGYEKCSLMNGSLYMVPDWTYQDGEPGARSEKQEHLRREELRLISEIYGAARFVLEAKKFEKDSDPKLNS